MLFNSFEFLLFLPIVFLLYWFVFRTLRQQNLLIVIASFVFYGWWDWRFLILMGITILCSFASGILIEKNDSQFYRKFISASNICLNLAILCVFKYFNFFIENFTLLLEKFGIYTHPISLNIILPVGISFYTFQALSYTIDVYRRSIEPTKDIIAFFAFISFFPQLVAGPIERATNLLPQFLKQREFDYDKAVDGCRQMLWGFFKKIVIADNCAVYVDKVFNTYEDQIGSTLLIAAIFFAFQVYGDFSGYSDIAIGTARLFGINLMQNFNFPYFSRDIAEFWRRWHISLTTWFRDYIYIPLGGSRTTKAKVFRNTVIIFLVSGFWHGANWTYVAWGAYHAVLFLPLIVTGNNRRYTNVVAEEKILPSIMDFFKIMATFFLVVIGWVFFRAESISQALEYLQGMLHFGTLRASYRFFIQKDIYQISWLIVFMLIFEWRQRSNKHVLEFLSKYKMPFRYSIYTIILFLIVLFFGRNVTFIYFQF